MEYTYKLPRFKMACYLIFSFLDNLDLARKLGANTVRTWGVEHASIQALSKLGVYRIYAIVRDQARHSAAANSTVKIELTALYPQLNSSRQNAN